MAKRRQYGLTWWGKQWLNALTYIDLSNRIPRGKSYANKGAVQDFTISKNNISAKVQGSVHKPYEQEMALVPFTKVQKEIIIETIRKDIGILAVLLSRQLPQAVDKALQKEGIRLFPKDWRSLSMACSCPDYAVPCKHLAAVIYLIADEVDKNPFILFELRGLSLLSELEKQGVLNLKNAATQKFNRLKDFVLEEHKELYAGNITSSAFEQLPFALPKEGMHSLLTLLDNSTLFYTDGSFKQQLKDIYKKTLQFYTKKLKQKQEERPEDLHKKLLASNSLHININKQGYFKNIWLYNSQEDSQQALFEEKTKQVALLMELLASTKLEELWQYPNQWIALYSIYRFAENLVLSSNFMPRLLKDKAAYRIQWIPADINPAVNKNMQALLDFCSGDLMVWLDEDGSGFTFELAEQLRAVCDIFIGFWVANACEKMLSQSRTTDAKVMACFVDRTAVRFNKLGEKEIPSSIQLWLRKFYLQHKRYVPLIRIEEAEHGFSMKLQIEDRQEQDKLPVDWDIFLRHELFEEHRLPVIQDVQLLVNYLPEMSSLLKSPPKLDLYFGEAGFEDIFFRVLPIMELLGITILLPKALRKIAFPKISMSISSNESEGSPNFMSLSEMLEFDWKIALGGKLLSLAEFKALVAQKSGLVKIQNQYVHIDKDQLQKLLKQLETGLQLKPQDLIQAALSGNYKGASVLVGQEVQEQLARIRQVEEIPLPKNLRASLRPYQLTGYSWLYKTAQLGMGAILADDMGLGKTLQVICLMLKFKEEQLLSKKKALIVVPTSLLTNWQKEVEKFAPALHVEIFHGPQRVMPSDFDLLVTSYGVLRSDTKILKKQKWLLIVIDEAQNIKNVSTAQTKAVKSIKADIHIAMSGTPVENRLSEYWSIMDFANKGYLGTISKFITEFAKPIQNDHNKERLQTFQKITSPFILRRLKSDKSIIKDLPDKIEKDYYISLEKEQAAVYENLVSNTLTSINEAEGIARKGLVLSLMTGLKQICNHPYQFLKKGDNNPLLSGKAKALFNLLDNISVKQEKVLIFTQYKEMGDLLVEWIQDKYGRAPLFLHGGKSRKQRDGMVEAFQNNRLDNIFILSLKAGGTGLTLTAANHVIHYDLWWNPAVEAQATDRAYRIGQQKNVLVYRLLCEGTLEEKIDAMLKAKKELADLTVATGEKWLGDLSDSELQDLVRLNC